jgi:SulP family sulfate permease
VTLATHLGALVLRKVPAFASLHRYTFSDLRRDLVAGTTVATVAVPQAMAYGLVAGVPPEHALYTAIVMTTVGALLDSSRQLINGPTNAISIALLSALATVPAERHLEAAILMALLIGGWQLLITILRLGDLSRYISHSVIVGFTLGASALLVLDQVKNLFGLKAMGDAHDPFVLRFLYTVWGGGPVHITTTIVGFSTIALVIALRMLRSRLGWVLFPDLLLTVVMMAAATSWLGLDAQGVKVVGDIPAKLPSFRFPTVDPVLASELASSALAIGLLGLLEAIAMAKAIAAVTRQKLDMNQQCLAESCANLAASCFQAIPGSGSLTRSAINQQAGGVTQWAGVVSAIAVAAIVVAFAPFARTIPKATLAGILIVASYRMVDWPALAYHVRTTRFDAWIVAATALSAALISIEFCVIIGVAMSFVLAVQRAGAVRFTEFIVAEDGVIHERNPGEQADDALAIFGLEGELFFGSSSDLEHHLEGIEDRLDGKIRVIVLRCKRVRNPDAVCLHLLGEFIERCAARGVRVLLCGVRPDLMGALDRAGATRRFGPFFAESSTRNSSTLAAIRYAHQLIDEDPGATPPRGPRPSLVAVAG